MTRDDSTTSGRRFRTAIRAGSDDPARSRFIDQLLLERRRRDQARAARAVGQQETRAGAGDVEGEGRRA